MHMSFIQWLLAVSVMALECVLLFLLVRRKLRQNFPFFTSYLVLDIVGFGVLAFTVQGSSEPYFYSFWLITGLGMLLSFLVLYEMFVSALKPYSAVADLTKMLFGWAALFLLGAGLLTAFSTSGSEMNKICASILLTQRTLQLMQCGLLMLLVVFETRLGLSWRSLSMSVPLGLGTSAAVGLIASYLSEHVPSWAARLDLLDNTARVGVLALWVVVLVLPQPERATAQDSPKRLILQRWNEALIAYRQGDMTVGTSSMDSFLPGIEKTVDKVLARKIAN